MKTSTKKLMCARAIGQSILFAASLISCAMILKGDSHAGAVFNTLALTGGMSLLILISTMSAIAKKDTINHDA
jgi:hypothetical protein